MSMYHSSPLLLVWYSFLIPKMSVPAPIFVNGKNSTCSAVLNEVPAKASDTCWAVRSSFQTRTSSTFPIKKLPVGGVVLELAPILTGFVPELSGDAPEVDLLATWAPSTYSLSVVPSYVTTA